MYRTLTYVELLEELKRLRADIKEAAVKGDQDTVFTLGAYKEQVEDLLLERSKKVILALKMLSEEGVIDYVYRSRHQEDQNNS